MPLKTFDSTTISLCLSLFEWATFRRKKGGIKLHTMFNNREQIPEFVNITEAGLHDVSAAVIGYLLNTCNLLNHSLFLRQFE